MGYVELKPVAAKVGVPPTSSPMPSSAVSTEVAANPSKETGDHEPETVKSVTKVDMAPTVTPKSDSKGSVLSAKAPPFVPSATNTTAKSSVSHDTVSLPPSSRGFAQTSTRTATDARGQANPGASAAKGEDGVTNPTKASNIDSEVRFLSPICIMRVLKKNSKELSSVL